MGVPTFRTSQGTTRINLGGIGFDPNSVPPKKEKKSTHDGASAFGVFYANELAREALTGGHSARFPTGSIIVREKLSKPDDARPQLLAVMVKRAAGFNPKGGDWEFLVIDGALTKIRERQKQGSCLDCHASQRERDFVFTLPASK